MTDGHEPLSEQLTEQLEEAEERDQTFEGDLRDLAGHVRDYAKAELTFQKTRVAFAGKSALVIALWFVAAGAFLLLTVMALVFGLILALAPIITAWGATAAVCGVLLVAAGISLLGSLRRWRKVSALLEGDDVL